jgi:integrase
MNINNLILHYTEVKSLHSPLPESLADKLKHISFVYGHMPVTTEGKVLVAKAKENWSKAAPGTVKRYLVQLRAVLNRAQRDGLIKMAPVIDMPYVNDTVYVDVTGSEVNMLLDYIKWTEPSWYPLVLVLAHTGARLGEALSMTPGCFTRHGTRISKPVGRRSKTIERTIPYTQRLHVAVASGAIFRNERLTPTGIEDVSVPTCLGRVLDTSTKALGLPKLRVHDLRHAFAAVLAENGADLADLVAALGHSSPTMAMRYRGLVKGRLNTIIGGIQ